MTQAQKLRLAKKLAGLSPSDRKDVDTLVKFINGMWSWASPGKAKQHHPKTVESGIIMKKPRKTRPLRLARVADVIPTPETETVPLAAPPDQEPEAVIQAPRPEEAKPAVAKARKANSHAGKVKAGKPQQTQIVHEEFVSAPKPTPPEDSAASDLDDLDRILNEEL